jgi:hypothetical protein
MRLVTMSQGDPLRLAAEVVADLPAEPLTEAEQVAAVEETAAPGRLKWLLLREGTDSGDGRFIEQGGTTWRDLPLPFMAQDDTTPAHEGARLVANLVEITREGSDIFGFTEDIPSEDPKVLDLQRLMHEGHLRGVSVDMDDAEGYVEFVIPELIEPDENGVVRQPFGQDRMVFTASRIMGATAVPFPAFAESKNLPEGEAEQPLEEAIIAATTAPFTLVASGHLVAALPAPAADPDAPEPDAETEPDPEADEALVREALADDPAALEALDRLLGTEPDEAEEGGEPGEESDLFASLNASFDPIARPHREWFENPRFTSPQPITITDEGRVFGHIALWKSCHRGRATCTPPPKSRTNYANFHTGGQVIVSDGGRVGPVGHITVDGGHADESLSLSDARRHYDETGFTAVDCVAGEDRFGIWVAGAVTPGLSDVQLHKLMSHDVSGDWRPFNGDLDLLSIRTVPVPGFVKTAYSHGMVASYIASVPVCEDDGVEFQIADTIAWSIGRGWEERLAAADELAFELGRHPTQRLAALHAAVHGEES